MGNHHAATGGREGGGGEGTRQKDAEESEKGRGVEARRPGFVRVVSLPALSLDPPNLRGARINIDNSAFCYHDISISVKLNGLNKLKNLVIILDDKLSKAAFSKLGVS